MHGWYLLLSQAGIVVETFAPSGASGDCGLRLQYQHHLFQRHCAQLRSRGYVRDGNGIVSSSRDKPKKSQMGSNGHVHLGHQWGVSPNLHSVSYSFVAFHVVARETTQGDSLAYPRGSTADRWMEL